MHIKEAKKQIRNAVIAYTTKDEYGRMRIPAAKQRPVFLVGAPGIGKTAIVEQIARELNLGFVSYAMTHHTRQSALGLPFIEERVYAGKTYHISEYTMSEIISSIYEEMEKTGKKEGILFLDEINCVSETLAPSMLQFLQFKTFGRHSVPEGWIVVTAGNPPEYNDSVRDFDIVMLDRLKKIEVEPDLEVWKEFALQNHVHPAILSYLAIKPQHFYRVSTTVDGKQFVTARAWDDLSQMLVLYEENSLEADRYLITQYIQDEEIAKDFANYYDLYRKYESDYEVDKILDGVYSEEIVDRASAAKFDERLSLISLILSSLEDHAREVTTREGVLRSLIPEIRDLPDPCMEALEEMIQCTRKKSEETDTKEHIEAALAALQLLLRLKDAALKSDGKNAAVSLLKEEVIKLKACIEKTCREMDQVFTFFEKAFGTGQEMLILVSELTIRPGCSKLIFDHGCEKYYTYNKKLLFEEEKDHLSKRIEALKLPEL